MDLDPSNPVAVIFGFFALLVTAFMFIIKFATMGLAGGLIGVVVALFGGAFVWTANFKGK